uniref:C2H2-type domain-containing protein n=1 Tax=Clytia hemisphaerica TaxID=252671 RepID=A0A7M5X003_9CNID
FLYSATMKTAADKKDRNKDLNEIQCTNTGCTEKFKWRMQLKRHLRKCNHERPIAKVKKYTFSDGHYVCNTCFKRTKHQPNMSRHVNNCNPKKAQIYACDLCAQTFEYKCRLVKHMKKHTSDSEKICPNCGKMFR